MKNIVTPQQSGAWRNRIVGEGVEHPEQLLANPRNWRIHPREQQAALTGMLQEVGWVQRVIVNKRTGFVVDGHMRVEVAISAGETEVPVLYVDLSEEEEAKVLATFDPISGMAAMDAEKFKELVSEIEFASKDAAKSIEAAADSAGVEMGDPPTESDAEPQIDRAAELNKKWRVKPGDLWRIGEHRLLCGDSTKREDVQRVMGGESCEICFTSPPYNAGDNSLGGNKSMVESKYKDSTDDLPQSEYFEFLRGFTDAALQSCQFVIVNIQQLAGNKIAVIEWAYHFRSHLADRAIWFKGLGQPAMARNVMNSRFEDVWILSQEKDASRAINTADFHGTVPNVYQGNGASGENVATESHAATMPLHFAHWAVSTFCKQSVYEPFCGSGTTMVACENLGRKCRGIEISPNYCAVIMERMQTAFPKLKIERVKP